MMKTEELKLVQEWDKTFPKSDGTGMGQNIPQERYS